MQKTFVVEVTVPANQAQYSRLPAKVMYDPTRGAQDYYQAPTYGGLAILDIFVKGAPGVDGILVIKRNGQEIYWTHPVSTLDITNPSRPKEPEGVIILNGGDKLELDFINFDSPASDTTVKIYMKVDEETG